MNAESTITLTFGDRAENHVGMEQLGEMVGVGEGFQYQDLVDIYHTFTDKGVAAELYHLHDEVDAYCASVKPEEAYILVLRKATEAFERDTTSLWAEQVSLPMDKKALMYGRVVNKHARWNLCFDDESHDPDYSNGKGRVIGYDQVPHLRHIVQQFPDMFGAKSINMKGEGNYYYSTQCGIGFHGDSERRKVIALRLGATMSLYYQWYRGGQTVGPRIQIQLHDGDMYIMSEKAVGTDWKKKNIYTLRHAAGADKFTTYGA